MPVGAGEHNLRYLRTKRDRMGHDLPWLETAGRTHSAVGTAGGSTVTEQRGEK
jgi:3,4-dihydroxy 2-butanone 4-phosphate synthase/GTP cyclohydrolase II